jgi:putative hydrolase of the HAD superfamily
VIKAILFDLDGTLLDRESSLQHFISAQHDRLPAVQHIPKQHYASRFIELDDHGHVWKDAVYQALVIELGITAASWEELLADYESQFAHSAIPYPDLVPVLNELTSLGYCLGLIGNGRSDFQRSAIRSLGVEQFLGTILISEEEGIRKPETEIFQRASRRLRMSPGETIFVGDHPVADIEGASRAGMKTIWVRNTVWGMPVKTDAIIETLRELPAAIQLPA